MPRTAAITDRLKSIIEDLSGYSPEELPENSTFLELGFDSLFLTQLATAFQNEFGIEITFRQLFDELPTIAAVVGRLDAELPPERHATTLEPTRTDGGDVPPEHVGGATEGEATVPAESPLPSSDPARGERTSALHELITQQLDLMERQIILLQGGSSSRPDLFDLTTEGTRSGGASSSAASMDSDADPGTSSDSTSPPSGFGPSVRHGGGDDLDARQRAHLDGLIARYTERTRTSKDLTQRYRRWHADPRTAAGFNQMWKEMVYPIWVKRSLGARLWDVDDNEYIDLLNGFGPNFLGHSPPFVTEALRAQLERGIEVGPQTPLAGETAELFCKMTGMDRVSFVNTGSEAVQAAIRLSRTVTGRDTVVVFRKDYHGNFDEVLVRGMSVRGQPKSMPLAPGIPRRAVQDVVALDYGSEEALDWMRANASNVAAVLVEPVQSRKPELQPRSFLHELRAITQAAGTVLVFDEVITGFRTGPGGAQAMFDVEADLATYGKVVGGGMPIGAVAGRSRFMDTFDGGMWSYDDDSFPAAGVTFFAGTFVRHPMAIAAANAVLKYLGAQGASFWETVNRKTDRFTRAANDLFTREGIAIEVPHCCSQMFIRVNEKSDLATLLFYHLRDRGVHLLEGFPSYMTIAHTEADVDDLISRLTSSVEEMQSDGLFPESRAGSGTSLGMRGEGFPLTAAQRDVWLASQVSAEASCAFNESDTVELLGPLDVEVFRRTAHHVIQRHQAFHLVFDPEGSTQRARNDLEFEVELVDLSAEPREARNAEVARVLREQAARPFDLEEGPLVRSLLIRLKPEHHLFVIYGHHLVFDGWSAEVFMEGLAREYSRAMGGHVDIAPEATPFSRYQSLEASFQQSEEGKRGESFWRSALIGLAERLELPTDNPRGSRRSFAGDTIHSTLDADLSRRIERASRELGVSTHAFLLSAFLVLLSRLSGQTDFVVGVPAAGQAVTGLTGVVGCCVNLVPVRADLEGPGSFADLARATRNAVLDSFEWQLSDLSSVIAELDIQRMPGRLPLIEVVFNYSGYLTSLDFHGLEAHAWENRRVSVFHDLFLNIVESSDGLVIDWDYNAHLFEKETLRDWIGYLTTILGAVSEDPTLDVHQVSLLSPEEQARLSGGP